MFCFVFFDASLWQSEFSIQLFSSISLHWPMIQMKLRGGKKQGYNQARQDKVKWAGYRSPPPASSISQYFDTSSLADLSPPGGRHLIPSVIIMESDLVVGIVETRVGIAGRRQWVTITVRVMTDSWVSLQWLCFYLFLASGVSICPWYSYVEWFRCI